MPALHFEMASNNSVSFFDLNPFYWKREDKAKIFSWKGPKSGFFRIRGESIGIVEKKAGKFV